MYWIYLTIFILAVLVPDIVPRNSAIFLLKEEQFEELIIFALGLSGFLIFRFRERQSQKNFEDKIKIQKEARKISKNLTDTYSYIGETNRKLDIMKNVSLNLLEMNEINQKKEKRFFDILLESIYILAKSRKFAIRFIDAETKKTEKEIKSRKKIFFKVENEEIMKNLKKDRSFIDDDYHFIVSSPKMVDSKIATLIISKNNRQQKIEDPEILKALMSQALFIHHCSKKYLEKGS